MSTTDKHTPGPWYYGIAYTETPVAFDYNEPGHSGNVGIIGANGDTVVGNDEYHVFNSAADARLICAAPDLLEALEMVMTNVRKSLPENQYDMIEAAIAKATGK